MDNKMEIWKNFKNKTTIFFPAVPYLGIYVKRIKLVYRGDICTPMYIAILFTIAKTWKQLKCPLMDKWIKKLWYICTMEYMEHCVNLSVVSDCLQPDGQEPTRLLCPWNSPGKNTGVGCHFLLTGIFPTQGVNLGLLHCSQIHYHLSH